MSKSDKEYHIKLQQKSLAYLKFEKEEYDKLSQKLKDLEANPIVKEYIEVKSRFHKKNGIGCRRRKTVRFMDLLHRSN
jgi:hypothetical protein